MRRTLLLLAVLLGGAWGTPLPATPPAAPEGGTHQLVDAGLSASPAILRAGSPLPLVASHEGHGTGPRGVSRQGASGSGHAWSIPSGRWTVVLAAGSPGFREHFGRLALLRAGRLSFSTTTPPPFRSV